jgi:hypothetical protein
MLHHLRGNLDNWDRPLDADHPGDLMIPTKLSHPIGGLTPDTEIRIYPDSGHGFLFQHDAHVADEVNALLS